MAKRTAKAEAIGTVWTAAARIQIIEDRADGKSYYKTIAECMDTPNAVKAAIAKVRKGKGGAALSLWVWHQYAGREYVGQAQGR